MIEIVLLFEWKLPTSVKFPRLLCLLEKHTKQFKNLVVPRVKYSNGWLLYIFS